MTSELLADPVFDLITGVSIIVLIVGGLAMRSAHKSSAPRRRAMKRSLSCPALVDLQSSRALDACAEMLAAFDEHKHSNTNKRIPRVPSMPTLAEAEAEWAYFCQGCCERINIEQQSMSAIQLTEARGVKHPAEPLHTERQDADVGPPDEGLTLPLLSSAADCSSAATGRSSPCGSTSSISSSDSGNSCPIDGDSTPPTSPVIKPSHTRKALPLQKYYRSMLVDFERRERVRRRLVVDKTACDTRATKRDRPFKRRTS